MNENLFYLARAIYIPAIICFVYGVICLAIHDPVNAGLAGILGAMLGIVSFCVAIKGAGLIKPTNTLKSGD